MLLNSCPRTGVLFYVCRHVGAIRVGSRRRIRLYCQRVTSAVVFDLEAQALMDSRQRLRVPGGYSHLRAFDTSKAAIHAENRRHVWPRRRCLNIGSGSIPLQDAALPGPGRLRRSTTLTKGRRRPQQGSNASMLCCLLFYLWLSRHAEQCGRSQNTGRVQAQ
jgi:hypothetical protein